MMAISQTLEIIYQNIDRVIALSHRALEILSSNCARA
jgi:hypothetical protein